MSVRDVRISAVVEHYVTLFDQGFLPNGLALHASLRRHGGDFVLWVLCLDERTDEILDRLNLPGVRTIALADVETPELLAVKGGRSRGEYYWTLTPFTPDMVFGRDASAIRATYIDADMWLRSSPVPIFAELEDSGASVLLTEHAYAPEFEQSLSYGIYCVQFMPFTREGSAAMRHWWQERVVEWCYAVPEDGKFGDQKYLDDWPVRFGKDVHVLSRPEWTQAPWNATRFTADDALVYHFHRLRTAGDDSVAVGLYRLPKDQVDRTYRPYLTDLRAAYGQLASVGFVPQVQSPPPAALQRAKDRLAFHLHNWPHLSAPYALHF